MAECYSLEKLQKDYLLLKKKYELPELDRLLEDFDIDKLTEKEPLLLAREIRKVVSEKITSYLALFEHFKNPSSCPMFIFSALKNASDELKKIVEEAYTEIAKIELISLKLDTIYNEKDEAEFIKKVYTQWQGLKKKIYFLLKELESNIDKSDTANKTSYFG